MPVPSGGLYWQCGQHDLDTPQYVPLHLHGLWQFYSITRTLRMGTLIAGIHQENGAGTQIWAAISSPLFDILKEEVFCSTYWSNLWTQLPACRFCFHGWYRPDWNWPKQWPTCCGEQNARIGGHAGGTALNNGRSTGARKMLLVHSGLWGCNMAVPNPACTYPPVKKLDSQLTPIPHLPVMEAQQTVQVKVVPDGNSTIEVLHFKKLHMTGWPPWRQDDWHTMQWHSASRM